MQELDKVLSDTVGMFTQKQLDEIMKEIDQDDSNTLDFFEVLTVGTSVNCSYCRIWKAITIETGKRLNWL